MVKYTDAPAEVEEAMRKAVRVSNFLPDWLGFKEGHRSLTPGETLREDYLQPLGIAPEQLACAAGLEVDLIKGIIVGTTPIDAVTAVRISRALGLPDDYWVNLQTQYDLAQVRRLAESELERIPMLVGA